jgi:hypothetical protein
MDIYFIAEGLFNATAPSDLFAMTLQKLSSVAITLNDKAAADK